MTNQMIEAARRFLAAGRLAVVGVSRQEKDFSRMVLRALWDAGIDALPVNPSTDLIEGRRCHASVADIVPPPARALLMTPPSRTEAAVRDCIAAGVRSVWFHQGGGPGSVTPEAVLLCREAGVEVITQVCPFMALPGASWPHRLHGFIRRLAG
jgi:predicted CoA-binding protein